MSKLDSQDILNERHLGFPTNGYSTEIHSKHAVHHENCPPPSQAKHLLLRIPKRKPPRNVNHLSLGNNYIPKTGSHWNNTRQREKSIYKRTHLGMLNQCKRLSWRLLHNSTQVSNLGSLKETSEIRNAQHDTTTDTFFLLLGAPHMAYLCVQSFACWLYFSRSVLYILAISGTSGSSGFGSVSREPIDRRTERRTKLLACTLGFVP